MDVSTSVSLALSIISVVLVIVSVIVAVITVRQNNKMIEASTRPYVVVTSEMTNFGNPVYYLVLKNFGQTGASIETWSVNLDLTKCSYGSGHTPFSGIEGTFLAPGQSIVCAIDYEKLKSLELDTVDFKFSYSTPEKTYEQVCHVNFAAYADLVHTRSHSSDGDLRNVSYALQDLVEKTF